jgi:hypothetical protein
MACPERRHSAVAKLLLSKQFGAHASVLAAKMSIIMSWRRGPFHVGLAARFCHRRTRRKLNEIGHKRILLRAATDHVGAYRSAVPTSQTAVSTALLDEISSNP